MKILAIDFSSSTRSVAVVEFDSERSRVKRTGLAEAEDRSSDSVALAKAALAVAGLEPRELSHIVIGLGPGSYTGIRASLAFARGWQLGRSISLAGIGGVELLVGQAVRDNLTGIWNVIVDAQRGEFYLAGFELFPGGASPLEPLRIVARTEVDERAARGEGFLGPEADVQVPAGRRVRPSARFLAELAAARGVWSDGDCLEPVYLRATQFVKAPPPRVF
jgi:tRNA threonylcarbamoyl adenosine modification protein YeaZ